MNGQNIIKPPGSASHKMNQPDAKLVPITNSQLRNSMWQWLKQLAAHLWKPMFFNETLVIKWVPWLFCDKTSRKRADHVSNLWSGCFLFLSSLSPSRLTHLLQISAILFPIFFFFILPKNFFMYLTPSESRFSLLSISLYSPLVCLPFPTVFSLS